MAALVLDALTAAKCVPSGLTIARLVGADADALAIAGLAKALPFVVDRDQAAQNPFARLRRPPLVISAAHPLVRAALVHPDPKLAATHLARAILLAHRMLDVDRSTALLATVMT
jgi:hypothetical protein